MLLFLLASTAFAAEPPTYTTRDYHEDFATGLIHTKRSEEFERLAPRRSFGAASVPGRFSMKGKAGPVENQGGCHACWSFSLTSVLRGTLMMSKRDPGRLSFNYLLNCETEHAQGCQGGSFETAGYLVRPRGAPAYGSDGEYTARQGECLRKTPAASAVQYHLLGDEKTGPSFRDVAYVLGVLKRPVSVAVYADIPFRFYGGGTFNSCATDDPRRVNHMVSLEGYDCESSVDAKGNCVFDKDGNLPPGVGKWIVRNSWGDRWGERGYMVIKATNSRGGRCSAIASEALYFDVGN